MPMVLTVVDIVTRAIRISPTAEQEEDKNEEYKVRLPIVNDLPKCQSIDTYFCELMPTV